MPPGNEYAAEQLKAQGNACFKNGDYEGAEAYYSQAIQKNSSNPLLFTNRAMARNKLEKWEGVIDDCIRSIEQLPENMKAFHLLCTYADPSNMSGTLANTSPSTSAARRQPPERSPLERPQSLRILHQIHHTDHLLQRRSDIATRPEM